MKDVTTIQLKKSTLTVLNNFKLQYEAHKKKRMSMDEYILELLEK